MTLDQVVSRWNLSLTFAVAVCTCIGGFLKLPPLLAQDAAAWSHFGVFAVALLAGLWFVPLQLYANRSYVRTWFISAIAFSILGIAGYFMYTSVADLWTFEYTPGMYVVAGAQLTPSALAAKQKLQQRGETVTNKAILWEEGGSIVNTWPDTDTRNHRIYVLLGLYLAELLFFATAIITVIQASYCASKGAF
jgi:hypothetical protein